MCKVCQYGLVPFNLFFDPSYISLDSGHPLFKL
jgi:hypothetical protein